MPIYEFTCNVCNAPLSLFVRSMNSQVSPKCGKCGSTDLTRAISSFAVLGASGSESGSSDADPDMASMMQKMGGMDDFGAF